MSRFRNALFGLYGLSVAILATACSPAFTYAATAESSVRVPTEDVFLLPVSGQLQVLERISLENRSSSVEQTRFAVPQGATGLQVSNVSKSAVQVTGDTVQVSAQPGATSVVISFLFPFSDQTAIQLDLPTNYEIDLAHIYVPVGNAALSAPDLMPDSQLTSIGGTDYRIFTHGAMKPGDDFVMSLSLLPSVTPTKAIAGLPIIGMDSQSGANTLQAIGNLALAAFILIVALFGIRSTMARNGGRSAVSSETALYHGWEELEELYRTGQLEEAVYQHRREALKTRLVELRLSSQKVGR